MRKFKIVGDNKSNPFHSSRIIIDNTNAAAKRLGLYSETDAVVCYDTLCNNHGYNPDAFWCAIEFAAPKIVLHNAGGKPVLGLSRDNALFITSGGYPKELVDFVALGVDANVWKPRPKILNKDKFVVTTMIESTVRACIPELIEAFGRLYSGSKDHVLYIKDREPTDKFSLYVQEEAKRFNIQIVHDGRHTENHEEEMKILDGTDIHIYLNRSGTFAMTCLQSMSCGVPFVGMNYSGPNEYLSNGLNGLSVSSSLVPITNQALQNMTEIGMKNYIFPVSEQSYNFQPYWMHPCVESIIENIHSLEKNAGLRQYLGYNAQCTASSLSWERTAVNMSFVLSKFGI